MEDIEHYLKKEALNYAKIFLKEIIIPLLKSTIEYRRMKKEIWTHVDKNILNYLIRTYVQCANIKSLAFNNIPKPIDDIYLPLTLKGDVDGLEITINNATSELERLRNILIIDSVGMGKSTLTKKIALEYLQAKIRIPFYLELRSYQKRQNLFSKFTECLGIDENLYDLLKKELEFVIILDGFDEISLDLKEEAICEIDKLQQKLSDQLFILTSRPDPYLNDLSNYNRFKIKQLDEKCAFLLLEKYDENDDYSKQIIKGIKSDKSGSFKEFLSTPLYVSLLYCAYKYKPILPRRKHLFYSQVYDALFESHDLSKNAGYVHEKISRLDSSEFQSVLRKFSFLCLLKNMRQEFLKDELEIYLSEIKENLHGISFAVSDFIRDIVETVPLFIKEGNNYRWAHKSLFEYFCSMYICHDAKEKQKEILLKLYKSKYATAYTNILELCADIDYPTFKTTILKEVFSCFSDYGDSILQAIKNRKVVKELVIERIGLTFDKQIKFAILKELRKASLADIFQKTEIQVNLSILIEEGGQCSTHLINGYFEYPIIIIEYFGINSVIMDFVKDKESALFMNSNNTELPIRTDGCKIPFDKGHQVNNNRNSLINNKNNFWIVNSLLKHNGAPIPNIDKIKESLCNILHNQSSEFESLLKDFESIK